jgi:hypothetical protein
MFAAEFVYSSEPTVNIDTGPPRCRWTGGNGVGFWLDPPQADRPPASAHTASRTSARQRRATDDVERRQTSKRRTITPPRFENRLSAVEQSRRRHSSETQSASEPRRHGSDRFHCPSLPDTSREDDDCNHRSDRERAPRQFAAFCDGVVVLVYRAAWRRRASSAQVARRRSLPASPARASPALPGRERARAERRADGGAQADMRVPSAAGLGLSQAACLSRLTRAK